MKEVQWSDDLSVGDTMIDEQHKMLIKRLNDLAKAVEEHHGAEKISETLGFLIDYTDFHFEEEEQKMAACSYPGLDAHKEKHQEYKTILADMERDYRDDGPTHMLAKAIDMLLGNWLVKHICDVDKQFGVFLEKEKD